MPAGPVPRRAEIQITRDAVAGAWTGSHQMLGAVLLQFPQHLFANWGYTIELCCSCYELTNFLLLIGAQRGAPLRRGH